MSKRDNNVDILRCVAIVCICLHHSISVYAGWPPNTGVAVGLSKWLILVSIITKGLGLGLFTFISGYLSRAGFESDSTLSQKIYKRIKRLIIPMFIVGSIYYIFFPTLMFGNNFVFGTHLWYLPVLFCMYVCMYVCARIGKINSRIAIVALTILFAFIIINLFYRNDLTSSVRFYWPIYVLGYFASCHKSYAIGAFRKNEHYIILSLFLLLCSAICFLVFPTGFMGSIIELFYTWLFTPIFAVVISSLWNNRKLPYLPSLLSHHSFQIYLFHQFVINAIILSINISENSDGAKILYIGCICLLALSIPLLLSSFFAYAKEKSKLQ